MRPETLQVAVLIASGAVIVAVPLMLLWLSERIRNVARDSTERALAALHAEHERALGPFTQKRHEVYARLYSRYRRAVNEYSAAVDGACPDFQKFSRDDLFRYLKNRDIRDRDASDAIAALDRGDVFAMAHLMSRMHRRVALRDAKRALGRAREFADVNELYLSENVEHAVENLRRRIEALAESFTGEGERADPTQKAARRDELRNAGDEVLQTMRNELWTGDGRLTSGRSSPELSATSDSYRQIRSKS